MSTRIEKIVARQQEKIIEGNYYEAHQQLRVIATRYVKSCKWSAAVDVLHGGAVALLQAGQGGSGGDLCLYLVEVLIKAEVRPDAPHEDKIFSILRAFPPGEPTRRRFIGEAIGWSSHLGDFVNGDPELHHVCGLLYCEDADPYDAERHFAFGTRDSPEALAKLEHEWYSQDESHTAALYTARCVFPYLLTRNLRSANKAYIIFTSRLCTTNSDLGVQNVSSATADMRLYPSLPLVNFLGLLLLACQRGSGDLFNQLKAHYAAHLRETEAWADALVQIGEIWFGISAPRQGNPLLDMMGSMLFGGSGSASNSTSRSPNRQKPKQVESLPQATELD